MEEKIERAIVKLKKQRFLNKNRVIDELFKETNGNNGILETSCVLSLKCPVSRTRIKTPIRFHQCKHAQCFDADSFFQLTLSSIIKKCPICNLQANYNSLVVDGLFYEIIKHTSNDVEQVILYSNGNWEIKDDNKTNNDSNNNRNVYSHRTKTTTTNNKNNNTSKHNHSTNEVYHYNIDYPPKNDVSTSKRSNNKNVTYTYKIIDDNVYYSENEDNISETSTSSSSVSPAKQSNNINYLEATKKKFQEDLNCLKYNIHQTSLHNDVIKIIDENQHKYSIENEKEKESNINYNINNANDDINEKMKTIQEITNTIQRMLDISINKSEKTIDDSIHNNNNNQNNNIKKNYINENDNITTTVNISRNRNKNDYDRPIHSYKIQSNVNDDVLRSTTSLELKNKIDAIEKEIENSKRKKQSLLERSEYISSKYKQDSAINSTSKHEIKITSHSNTLKNHNVGESLNSLTSSGTSGTGYSYNTSSSINTPTIIQIKTETIPQENNKSKIVYHYKII